MATLDICNQPQCLLQEATTDRRALAEAIVRVLAGESVADISGDVAPIEAHPRCIECTVRVLQGSSPLPSADDVERILHAGHWSHRRRRRGAKHGDRAADV